MPNPRATRRPKEAKIQSTNFAPSDRSNRPVSSHLGVQQHLADSWMQSTKGGYSSGVAKYAEFVKATLGIDFSAEAVTDTGLYSFIVWAGRSKVQTLNGPKRILKAATIKSYVRAVRAWYLVETLSQVKNVDAEIIALLLKSTENNETDCIPQKKKSAVTIRMLYDLVTTQYGKSEVHNTTIALALCAFWGMARLGEFIRSSYELGALTLNDTRFGKNQAGRYVRLYLRKGKTAGPGEIQIIHLQAQPSILDPVAAVERLILSKNGADPSTLLFSTAKGPLTKREFVQVAEGIWGPSTLDKWTGHSFRVGGATLRHNLGTSVDVIKNLGRWESIAYLRYIRDYSPETLEETKELLMAIDKRL